MESTSQVPTAWIVMMNVKSALDQLRPNALPAIQATTSMLLLLSTEPVSLVQTLDSTRQAPIALTVTRRANIAQVPPRVHVLIATLANTYML